MMLLWVGIGGFLGANARYLIGRTIVERYGAAFPWGTLAINLTGAFLIGVIAQLLLLRANDDPMWRLLVVVGFLGGYTTFSSYALELVALLEGDQLWRALAYLAVSNAAGVGLCWLGITLTRRLV
jgi:CrcB protein